MRNHLRTAGAVLSVFCLTAMTSIARAEGRVVEGSADGSKYFVYVPSSYDPSKKYPLIVALHYSTGRGTDMIAKWKEPAEKKGYLVAAPNADNPEFWRIPGEEGKVLAMLKEVERDYSVDKKRVCVMGFSAGATFAYYMGLEYPKKFTALAAHAGRFEWVEKNAHLTFGKRIPVFILHGKRDGLRDTTYAEYAERRLSKKGYPTKLLLIDGLDHTYPVQVSWYIVQWLEKLSPGPEVAEEPDKAEPAPKKRETIIEFE